MLFSKGSIDVEVDGTTLQVREVVLQPERNGMKRLSITATPEVLCSLVPGSRFRVELSEDVAFETQLPEAQLTFALFDRWRGTCTADFDLLLGTEMTLNLAVDEDETAELEVAD